MRRWVDLFSAKIPEIRDPEAAELVARIVSDNARHMVLFRQRALAHSVDPDAYVCPPEGEAIYEPIPALDLDAAFAYALGSLEHFAELLEVYRAAADDAEDAAVLDAVRLGHGHGFDSGPFMAHVYANEARGRTRVGRWLDRRLLERDTCRAFREIRGLACTAVAEAIEAHPGAAPLIADLAAGPAPYLLEELARRPGATALVRDVDPAALAQARATAVRLRVESRVRFEQADAFDRRTLDACRDADVGVA